MNRGLMFEKLFKKVAELSQNSLKQLDDMQPSSSNPAKASKGLAIDEQKLNDIHAVIDRREIIEGVLPRDEDFTELEVVGESFYLAGLSNLANGKPGSEAGWFSGFLLPEPQNKYDRNAIAVYLIDTRGGVFKTTQVGYLGREEAAELGPAISGHINKTGEIIPLLGRIIGGENESKPNYGVIARVFWDFL